MEVQKKNSLNQTGELLFEKVQLWNLAFIFPTVFIPGSAVDVIKRL